MGMKFDVVYFQEPDGKRPLEAFLEGIRDPKHKGKPLTFIDFLQQENISLREPYTKKLDLRIFELRVPYGKLAYRVLFFYEGRTIVLTNAFWKKTEKTPTEELARANAHRRIYLDHRNHYGKR